MSSPALTRGDPAGRPGPARSARDAWRHRARLPWRPDGRSDRLLGVDVARSVALVGMVATHVLPISDDTGALTISHEVFGGRSSALFAVLAGVSIALLTGRETPLRGPVRHRAGLALVLRAAIIGGIGLWLGSLDSGIAVILSYYAVLFICALPFLGMRPGRLLALGAGCAVVLPLVSYALRSGLDLEPTGGLPALASLREQPGAVLEELLLTGYYPVVPWLAYLLVGLGVGRLRLGSPRVALQLATAGAALALGARLLSELLLRAFGGYDALAPRVEGEVQRAVAGGAYGIVPTDTTWWLAVAGPHTGTPLDLLHTIGTALLVLGAALLVVPYARLVLLPLAAAGGMSLTLYTTHVWLFDRWDGAGPAGFYATQVLLGLLLALAWRTTLGRGPLEAVIAAVTRPVRGASAARRTQT